MSMNINGNHSSVDETVNASPYLSKKLLPSSVPDETTRNIESEDDNMPATDPATEKLAKKHHRQKIFVGVLIALFALAAISIYAYAGRKQKINYEVKERPKELSGPVSAPADGSTLTDQATKQAQEEYNGGGHATAQTDTSPAKTTNQTAPPMQAQGSQFALPSFGQTVNPRETSLYLEPSNSRQEQKGTLQSSRNISEKTEQANSSLPTLRRRETSTYISDSQSTAVNQRNTGAYRTDLQNLQVSLKKIAPVVLPNFGSVLPVRTLGAVYTLRIGSLVRLELTRDVQGEGWSLKRGTIFVGNVRGSEADRAFINAFGFLDSSSGHYVKLNGEVVGTDGAEGLRGKRHQLSSGWRKTLSKLGSSAVNLGAALATNRGNSVIVNDGAVSPATDELSGVVSNTGQQQAGFVEVLADTSGYILITDLPAETKGIDAIPEIKSDEVVAESDPNIVRVSTGLSMREMADLLTSGSPDEIKAALPRMSPEMKRLALAVLGEDK